MNIRLPHGRVLRTGAFPLFAGILNLSADSFSGDGAADWKFRAEKLVHDGADMLDIGAESTRPGAAEVPEDQEKKLLVPAICFLRDRYGSDLVISVDTRKSGSAEAALEAGADIVNDVSGLHDPKMARTVAEYGAGLVLMHSRGTPETMQTGKNLCYDDVVQEVCRFFEERLLQAEKAGICRESIMLDPGIGFAKTPEQNLVLIRAVKVFRTRFGLPMYYGVSRKSFIGAYTGIREPLERDAGTIGVLLYLMKHSAEILRVHDAGKARAALSMYKLLENGEETDPFLTGTSEKG